MTRKDLPDFAAMEFDEKVQILFDYIQQLEAEIKGLREENARLKGLSPKPVLSPANPPEVVGDNQEKKKRGGSKPGTRRSKTRELEIHQTQVIQPEGLIPEGFVFKGYQEYVVQDLKISACNTLYKLARWESPDGKSVMGVLPNTIDGHFGNPLRGYILYQHNQCRVTEPLLLEQLHEFGIEISSGQLHAILTQGHEIFHEEKQSILEAGLQMSPYVQVDDTGARHDGKNGFCTVICNPFFAYFETTYSKSRINFLNILRGLHQDYIITEEAIEYAKLHKLPLPQLQALGQERRFENTEEWERFLRDNGIEQILHVRIATEAALIGSLMEHGFNPNLVILSDDAGQFNIFLHALCWIHAERLVKKLSPYTEEQVAAVAQLRAQIWDFYDCLKEYKNAPTEEAATKLDKVFDDIFQQQTCYTSLNALLKRLYKNKAELLLVLSRPEVPLHNNQSESDIREKVQRRKISVTFSSAGRKCRDTFSSLKKTCRKNGISFWEYLNDRLADQWKTAPLSSVIRTHIQAYTEPIVVT